MMATYIMPRRNLRASVCDIERSHIGATEIDWQLYEARLNSAP